MSRPVSGKQLDKLGRRLASADRITDDDYDLLRCAADMYQAALDKVEERLRAFGFDATTRVKTTGTLVDKLRRNPHLSLKSIQDFAGARIVIDGGRLEQDQVVDRMMQEFAACPKPPQRIDRREHPSHGYRAVHVIAFEDGVPVEIQVRTKMQDSWAQISEKLGDMWGRGLRYGEGPDQPDKRAVPDRPETPTRGELVQTLAQMADRVDAIERIDLELARLKPQIPDSPAAQGSSERLSERVAGLLENQHAVLGNFMEAVTRLEGWQ